MKKRIFGIAALVLAVAAAVYGFRWYQAQRRAEGETELRIYGTVDIRDARLAFNEPERLVDVLVEEGERVEAGQVLARQQTNRQLAKISRLDAETAAQEAVVKRLHAGSRPQEIEQGRAEVAAARVRLENSRSTLKRLEQTVGSGAASKQDLDTARSHVLVDEAQLEVREKALNLLLEGPRSEDIAAAEKQLDALRAQINLEKIRLDDMTLTAPATGIIQSRILEPGEMAGPSAPVFILALDTPKWVRAYVPEPQLGRIRLGLAATVYNDTYPDTPLDGWVGFISPVAEFTPRTVQTEDLRTRLVYEARIFVSDEDDLLRMGMPVTVGIGDEQAAERSEKSASPRDGQKTTDGGRP